jgi:hypothetical protein
MVTTPCTLDIQIVDPFWRNLAISLLTSPQNSLEQNCLSRSALDMSLRLITANPHLIDFKAISNWIMKHSR